MPIIAPEDKLGFVYFFLLETDTRDPPPDEDETEWYAERGTYLKVGFSTRPDVRKANMQTAIPFDLTPLAVYRGCEADERRVHERLKGHRAKREWFHYNDAVQDFMEELDDAALMICAEKGEGHEPTITELLNYENPSAAWNAYHGAIHKLALSDPEFRAKMDAIFAFPAP